MAFGFEAMELKSRARELRSVAAELRHDDGRLALLRLAADLEERAVELLAARLEAYA